MVGTMQIFCGKSEDGLICWSVESGYAGLEEIHKTTSLEMLLTGGEYLIKYQTRWFV